ncbi:hypothetical protein BELL_0344g00110 [Botrytis elliptica]|uniref:Uncharacterized protein n=1 Tax=Botrytis elliptica TaxID=278938 RepID=A0A4Z1JPY4_9HELO|nr:hypothetical protein EAE99_006671 [Botrytis elliptica]TGO73650.1 hypothetical protein BELL_0344g00110 [Botrytis elliptica]
MDGLSTAASVIAVVQLAQAVGGALMEYYEGVKSARDDIQRLYHSIKNLESVLKSINDLPHTLSINIQTLLENKTGTLSLCKAELDGIEKELDTFSKQQNHIGKLKSLIWPFKKKDVDKHVDFIDKHKHDLMLAFGVENLHMSMHHHNILEDIQSEIRAAQRDKERSQIIEWLTKSLPDPSTEHNIAREKFQEGTGSWLIDGNHLNTWSKTNNSFLWLNGGAGAGKSILWHQLCKQEINVVVTYWYIKFDNLTTQSVSNIIRSWIRDICSNRRDTPQTLKDAYAYCNHGQQQPTIKQMMEILKSVVTGLQDVYLVVDALDEYPKAERDLLLEALKDIHQWKIDSIHIFVTSRAEDDIRFHLDEMRKRDVSDSCQSIRVQDPIITEDIKKFLHENISSFRQTMWSSDFKDEVVESVARQADGMFRLAALQLESLKLLRTMSAVKRGLNQLPKSLDTFYERALKEISDDDQYYVRIALQWIAYSARPLTVLELSEAVVVRTESSPYLQEDERLSCEGEEFALLDMIPSIFVTSYWDGRSLDYDESCWKGAYHIRFAHFSVLEFLQSSRTSVGPGNEYHLQELNGLESIAARCIAYLIHACSVLKHPYPEVVEIYRRFPLIFHAALCWTYYMQRLEFQNNESYNLVRDSHKLALLLMNERWASSVNHASLNNQNAWEILQIICKSFKADFPYSASELALSEPNRNSMEYITPEPCPLSWACYHGLISLVPLLLSNVPYKSSPPNKSKVSKLGTPLHAAAAGWYFSERIVTLLLAAGMDTNISGGEWYYPLISAAAANRSEICKLLHQAGARLDHASARHGTALHAACRNGNVDLCEYFLENGANIESRGSCDSVGTPLLMASANGNLGVIKILLASGANIEAEHDSYTPLQYASMLNDVQACEMLLGFGPDVNHKTIAVKGGGLSSCWRQTWTPLHRAFALWIKCKPRGNDILTTIELLLKAGADVLAKGGPWEKNGPMDTTIVLCLNCLRDLDRVLGASMDPSDERTLKKALDMLLDAGAGSGADGAELLLVLDKRGAMLEKYLRGQESHRKSISQQRSYLSRRRPCTVTYDADDTEYYIEERERRMDSIIEEIQRAILTHNYTYNRVQEQQEKEGEVSMQRGLEQDSEEKRLCGEAEGVASRELNNRIPDLSL